MPANKIFLCISIKNSSEVNDYRETRQVLGHDQYHLHAKGGILTDALYQAPPPEQNRIYQLPVSYRQNKLDRIYNVGVKTG